MSPQSPLFSGPLESGSWPEALPARVITPGAEPQVHGYDVESDLVHHYDQAELVLLSLTGELPEAPLSRVFQIASMFLAPVSVAHASTHAGVLARLCGATPSATIGVLATALAEQAQILISEHGDLLEALNSPCPTLPDRHRTSDSGERAAIERLLCALASTQFQPPFSLAEATRDAALLTVLHACGLEQPKQLQAAIVFARLPSSLAEAFAQKETEFDRYPINLPRFIYEESP